MKSNSEHLGHHRVLIFPPLAVFLRDGTEQENAAIDSAMRLGGHVATRDLLLDMPHAVRYKCPIAACHVSGSAPSCGLCDGWGHFILMTGFEAKLSYDGPHFADHAWRQGRPL